ncbi:MAG: MotA/TolQ/ExbB proton channel family protein, partial [Myxococcaceae bacterium]
VLGFLEDPPDLRILRGAVSADDHPPLRVGAADLLQLSPERSAVELTRRELERKSEALNAEIRRGMGVLASVGSVAPFVGLLGTVVGIITCFEGISAEGSGGLGAVSAGIAEALVVTALGLLVAIPAVLAFNFLSSQADGLSLALDQARGQLVDALESGSTAHLPNGAKSVELPAPGVATRDGEGHVRANA